MDRRKKRTSLNQYLMYIKMLEEDEIFRTGNIPRDVDISYISHKWKELAENLNTCSNGPSLTSEEWKKRLNDWKNSTRCKYRRSQTGDNKDITLTPLETKALNLFGKAPASIPLVKTLKSEDSPIVSKNECHEEYDDQDVEVHEIVTEVLEDHDQVSQEELESVTSPPLIKLKRRSEHIIEREVSNAENATPKRSRVEEYTATATALDGTHHISIPLDPLMNFADATNIATQLKRIADLKEEKLKFEIAKFKFNNPGFHFGFASDEL